MWAWLGWVGAWLGVGPGSRTSCLPFMRHTSMSLGLERQVSFCRRKELVSTAAFAPVAL